MQSCGSGGGRVIFMVASFGYEKSIEKSIPHSKDFYEEIDKKSAFFIGHLIKNLIKLGIDENK